MRKCSRRANQQDLRSEGILQEADAELFSMLCDVVERAWQHWPVDSHEDDAYRHTSTYARSAAMRILDALEEYEEMVEQAAGRLH